MISITRSLDVQVSTSQLCVIPNMIDLIGTSFCCFGQKYFRPPQKKADEDKADKQPLIKKLKFISVASKAPF